MKLTTINTGLFKLDGGAMFGVVPKQLWTKKNPPDDNNMCTWAMRCLLIESGNKKILVDTGIGNKQDAKFRSHFEPHGADTLFNSIQQHNLVPKDITDVLLTHLHFDHSGGALLKNGAGKTIPTFPNATYWSCRTHYDWAIKPNPREKASFLKENFVPLMDADRIKFIDESPDQLVDWIAGIKIRFAYGHTEAMMLLHVPVGKQTLVYCADLIPSVHHIGMPWVMAYDIRPLVTMAEKSRLLQEAVENNYLLFFEHDPTVEAASLKRNERGRIVVEETFRLEERFGV